MAGITHTNGTTLHSELTVEAQDESRDKIKTLDDLQLIVAHHKTEGKTIVQCHGVFDLLHPGHMQHLQVAKQNGDILIVTLTPDAMVNKGPGRPVFNQRIRLEAMAALGCVDYVALNKWPTAVEVIEYLKPDVFAKGNEFSNRNTDLTGAISKEENAVQRVGGRLLLTEGITFSSSELLNQYYSVYPPEADQFLKNFRNRHTASTVINELENLRDLKVLIIGEAIIDEYHYCEPMGKSVKESIVASRFVREENFLGGSLACANHLSGFCKTVDLITCLGEQNSREAFIREHLKPNVSPTFFYRKDAPTIVKRRYVWEPFLTKLFEIYKFEDTPISPDIETAIDLHLNAVLQNYDLVLVTDYGHGMLTAPLINRLCTDARFLAVNTQTNSANFGFNLITKYPRADYVCIDEPEIRLATHDRTTDIYELAKRLSQQLQTQTFTVTRGHRGSVSISQNQEPDIVPVFSTEVKDRVGAGDAFLAITAPMVCRQLPNDMVSFAGNAVGAIAVRIVGNRNSVEPVPLQRFITALLK